MARVNLRVFSDAEREHRRAEWVRASALPPEDVFHLDTSLGLFELRRSDARGWFLTGDAAKRLFGFGEDWDWVPIHATCDSDAVASAGSLIASRWSAELEAVRAAFAAAGAKADGTKPEGTP